MAAATKNPVMVTSPTLLPNCGFSNCVVSNGEPSAQAAPAVYLTNTMTGALAASAEHAGSVVVLLEGTSTGFFKTASTRFKQAWWLGSATDNNAGTLVYNDRAANVLGGMAPDGYADQSWFRMINGAQTFLMDEMPALPGAWTSAQNGTFGGKDSCHDLSPTGCPAEFPFLINPKNTGPCSAACANKICYKTKTEAAAGEGNCGSWCTKDANAGAGCGDNKAKNMCITTCPKDFPFPTHAPPPYKGVVCYKTKAEAAAGEGDCGSWCTADVNVGAGCGDNHKRICAATPGTKSSCHPSPNITSCEAECDMQPGCNAINFNTSHGCCLESCPANMTSHPKPDASGSCCGSYRLAGTSMPKDVTVMMRAIDVVTLCRNKALLWTVPIGKGHIIATGLKLLPAVGAAPEHEQAWVLDRFIRYASSLV